MRLVSPGVVAGLSLSAARLQAQQAQQSPSAPDLAHALLNPATNVETVYLSRERAASGFFWGAGPTMVFPSATKRWAGNGKWSVGPSAGVLRQEGGWTFTLLTAQAWSFAGDPGRPQVSTALLKPITAFTTSKGTSFGVDTTAFYNWTAGQWTVPVELSATQIVTIGRRPLSIGLAGRYGLTHPADSPAWGLVLAVALLLPK
jgi:hypothetical protein